MANKVVSCASTNALHFISSKHVTSKSVDTAFPVIEARNRHNSSKVPKQENSVGVSKKDSQLGTDLQHMEFSSSVKTAVDTEPVRPNRETVLKACFITCGGIGAAGLLIRQTSHFLADSGWLSPDCTTLMPYDFLPWHLGVTLGLVASVTALRQLLLKVWPDFTESSQTANQQILSSLEPWDCVAVAFSSGTTEELLFRGALLPLLGLDYKGVLVTGIVFGALHLTGGRNVAFAIWASVVGVLYGAASVWTSDLLVPMSAHSLANLVAALLWKYSATDQNRPPTER